VGRDAASEEENLGQILPFATDATSSDYGHSRSIRTDRSTEDKKDGRGNSSRGISKSLSTAIVRVVGVKKSKSVGTNDAAKVMSLLLR